MIERKGGQRRRKTGKKPVKGIFISLSKFKFCIDQCVKCNFKKKIQVKC